MSASSPSNAVDPSASEPLTANPGLSNTSIGVVFDTLGLANRKDRDEINEYVNSLWRRYDFEPSKAYNDLPEDLREKAEEELQVWLEENNPEAGRCRPWLANWFLFRRHTKPPIVNPGLSNTTASFVFGILGLPNRRDREEINRHVNSVWKRCEFDFDKTYGELPEVPLNKAKDELQAWLEERNPEAERCPWMADWFLSKRHRSRRHPKSKSND